MKTLTHLVTILVMALSPGLVLGQAALILEDMEPAVEESFAFGVNLHLGGLEVYGIHAEFEFDPQHLEYTGYSTEGTISDSLLTVVNVEGDRIYISLASVHALSSGGELIRFEFRPLALEQSAIINRKLKMNEDAETSPNTAANIQTVSSLVQPVLSSPADGATGLGLAPSLEWEAQVHADSYSVHVSQDSLFESVEFEQTLTDPEISLSGLSYQTKYFWRVKVANEFAETSYSAPYRFTTMEKPNEAPEVTNSISNYILNEDFGEHFVALLTNVFEDPEAGVLTFAVESAPDFVNTEIRNDSLFLISTPNAFGNGNISVSATDDKGAVITDTFSITVTSVNDLPFIDIAIMSPSLSEDFGEYFIGLLTEIFADPEGDALTFEIVSTNEFISAEIRSDSLFIASVADLNGMGELIFKATDSHGGEFSVTLSIEVGSVNDAPLLVIPFESLVINEDFGQVVVASLGEVFTDPEGGTLSFGIQVLGEVLTAEIVSGALTLNSIDDANGSAQIVITATDGGGASASDTLTITVASINDLPELLEIPESVEFKQGESLEFSFAGFFADAEDALSDLTIEVTTDPADIQLTIDPANQLITLTSPDYNGQGTIIIDVTDSDGGQVQVTIAVTVNPSVSIEGEGSGPQTFSLSQNYPNPFNPSSQITFGIPEGSEVRLEVFNMLGQKVATLAGGRMNAGWHTVTFDASGLTSGIYIYRIQAGEFVQTKRMMLIK